uniref:Integrase catalytic domain-containing protein n=1 Tax=Scophthalmus maximus TaxID=52904 RepID=A0A8D3C2Z4_SCOMX
MSSDTREYVSACSFWARSKASHRPPFLRPLPVPRRPWSHIAVDFVTGLPPSEGNSTILTIVDRFSKAVHLFLCPSFPQPWRPPIYSLSMYSDCMASLRTLLAFCQALGASASLSSGYHPQTNGQTERANKDLEMALRCVTARHPASWSTHLPWVEYAHNSLVCSVTGMSPFMAANGFQPQLFPTQQADSAVPLVQGHLRRAHRVWREALTRTAARNKRLADQHRSPTPDNEPGQKVWLSSRDLLLQTESRKLAPRYIGPYEIDRAINPSVVRLRLPPALKVHPSFHVSLLKPVSTGPLTPMTQLSIEEKQFTKVLPISAITDCGPIKFFISRRWG